MDAGGGVGVAADWVTVTPTEQFLGFDVAWLVTDKVCVPAEAQFMRISTSPMLVVKAVASPVHPEGRFTVYLVLKLPFSNKTKPSSPEKIGRFGVRVQKEGPVGFKVSSGPITALSVPTASVQYRKVW